MKYIHFIIFTLFLNYTIGQPRSGKIPSHSKVVIHPKKNIKTISVKLELSYLDSLKSLTDTVTFSQIIGLRKLDFFSGSIYFAGTYYHDVVILRLGPESNTTFNQYFGRCVPGTKLSFENVFWKNEDGTTSGPLTKLFILE